MIHILQNVKIIFLTFSLGTGRFDAKVCQFALLISNATKTTDMSHNIHTPFNLLPNKNPNPISGISPLITHILP